MPYLDVDILYAHIKPEDWLKQAAERVLEKIKKGQVNGYTNLMSVVELEIISLRDFDQAFSQGIHKRLREISKLHLMPLTSDVIEAADDLRESYTNLGVFDSLHAANASVRDKRIISTDTVYDQIEELERIDPRTL